MVIIWVIVLRIFSVEKQPASKIVVGLGKVVLFATGKMVVLFVTGRMADVVD